MKKIILSIFLSLLLVAFALHMNKSDNFNVSDLTLDNIEALARGEIIIEIPCMLIYPMPLCEYHEDEGIERFGVPYQ